MFVVNTVFTLFSLAFRLMARFTGFIGDGLLVIMYSLVAWGFVAPTESPEVYGQSLTSGTSLTFRIPIAIFLGYIIICFAIYNLRYRKITTYSRWIYAVRTFILLLLPIALLVMLATISLEGHLHMLIETPGELAGLAIFTASAMMCAWAFFGITYVLEDWISILSQSNDGINTTIPQSLMLPRRMIAILIKRQSEFPKP